MWRNVLSCDCWYLGGTIVSSMTLFVEMDVKPELNSLRIYCSVEWSLEVRQTLWVRVLWPVLLIVHTFAYDELQSQSPTPTLPYIESGSVMCLVNYHVTACWSASDARVCVVPVQRCDGLYISVMMSLLTIHLSSCCGCDWLLPVYIGWF